MKNILIIAPHPDDEVIGCGGLILKNNGNVKIVFLTDGITNHKIRKIGEHSIEQRRHETMDAMKTAKVKEKNLIFLGNKCYFALNKDLMTKTENSLCNIIGKIKPDEVYVSAYEGGHFDHDIANYLINQAVKKMKKKPVVYEYPSYNNYPGHIARKIKRRLSLYIPLKKYGPKFIPNKNSKPFMLNMSTEELNKKKAMLKAYTSQNKNQLLVKLYGHKDIFRVCPTYNYKKKPHGTLPLNYEITTRIRFKNFLESTG